MFPRPQRPPVTPGLPGGRPAWQHTGTGGSSPGKCWETPLKGQSVGAARLSGVPGGGTGAGAARGRRRVRLQLPRCRRDAGRAKRGERRRTGKARPGSPAAPSPCLAPSSPPSRCRRAGGRGRTGGTAGAEACGNRRGSGRRGGAAALELGRRDPVPVLGHRRPWAARAVSLAGLGDSRHPRCPRAYLAGGARARWRPHIWAALGAGSAGK